MIVAPDDYCAGLCYVAVPKKFDPAAGSCKVTVEDLDGNCSSIPASGFVVWPDSAEEASIELPMKPATIDQAACKGV
ncbi:OLC1v1012786C1 [Oldenlandia corymbosa var. corymbosa]|nr:OLC1v1012786C1 [Oldenlandia corymbosa var. corymbosa]